MSDDFGVNDDQGMGVDAAMDLSAIDLGSTCFDHVLDGDETDVDCGGSCAACSDGKMCLHGHDCVGGSCLNNVCTGTVDASTPPDLRQHPDGSYLPIDGGDVLVPMFAAASPFGAGTTPTRVALADFNHDGHLDIATLNSGSNDVSILLGAGDGTFGAAMPLTGIFSSLTSIGAGDFNADQKGDLVVSGVDNGVAPNQTFSVKLLIGKGDGSFQTAVPYYSCATYSLQTCSGSFAGEVGELLVAPLTNAAHPDVGVSIMGLGNNAPKGYFGALKSLVTGALQPYGPWQTVSPSNPAAMAAGDFDGDGNMDVAQLDTVGGNGKAHILTGDGTGNYALLGDATLAEVSTYAIGAADFNGDGKMDLVSANTGLSVYLGNGNGTFKAAKTTPGVAAAALAVGDLNGDGRPDVAVSDWTGGNLLVAIGKGDGTFFTTSYGAGNKPFGIALGDLNGDGKLDVVLADQSVVQVFINQTP
jgi:hypothetical protein